MALLADLLACLVPHHDRPDAHAAAWSIGLSSLFLVIGLLGAIMVRHEARKQV
jgi:hypothetical protein